MKGKKLIFSALAATLCLTTLVGCATTNDKKPSNTVQSESEKKDKDKTNDKKVDADHKHEFKETVVKEATCTEEGEVKLECTCGETKTEKVKPVGHNWADATCTKPKTCTKCGQTEGKELGHVWDKGQVTKEQTCLEKGTYSFKCTRCGYVHTSETPELRHNFLGGKCSRCDAKDPNYKPPVEHKHEYEDVYKNSKLVYRQCKTCGEKINVSNDSVDK